jgi:hypothetical protein
MMFFVFAKEDVQINIENILKKFLSVLMLQSHISGFQDEITEHHSKLKAHHVRREDEYLLLSAANTSKQH